MLKKYVKMLSYILFPICIYFPFCIYRYLKNSQISQCTYKFTFDNDLNKWSTFVLNYDREYGSISTFINTIDTLVDNELIEYENIRLTKNTIDITIYNKEGSYEKIMKILKDKNLDCEPLCDDLDTEETYSSDLSYIVEEREDLEEKKNL